MRSPVSPSAVPPTPHSHYTVKQRGKQIDSSPKLCNSFQTTSSRNLNLSTKITLTVDYFHSAPGPEFSLYLNLPADHNQLPGAKPDITL
jgi:hypothetical protein